MKTMKITKKTGIKQLIEKHPEAAEVLTMYGLHCVGCHFSDFDTIENGAMMHGMSEEEMEMMLKDVNKIVNVGGKKKKKISYIIPFKKRPIIIGQGNNEGSHRYWPEDKEDFTYSTDFLLPEGTEIVASREGVVTKVKSNGKKNYAGSNSKLGEKAYKKWMNEIEIKHKDGTYASYCHLKYNSSFVKVGDKVKQSQVVGLSGNTGWSSAPHLDFTIFKKNIKGLKIKSLKIKFADLN